VSCSKLSLSTFSLPGRIAGPEKRGAKSPAFEITWTLSVRLIWSRIGEDTADQPIARAARPSSTFYRQYDWRARPMHENRQKVYLLSGNVGQRINWEMSRNCLSESRAANSKQPFVYERLPQGQGFLAVDLQHADRRAADSGAADEHRAVIAEMVRPFVAAGMEQPGQLPGQRV